MKRKSKTDGMKIVKKISFSTLVENYSELAELRREYASRSAKERRNAADWHYHSQMANEIFNNAMLLSGKDGLGKSSWPTGFIALAIDPLYAPAILTVGSIEYQLGRIGEAMELFKGLAKLPEDEEDLHIIIDEAGDFLIGREDYENALVLYSVAEKACPRKAVYPAGAGYCLGKLGRYEEAIEKCRHVNVLEPDNYKHLNDLGYSLLEFGKLDEAEEVLKRAVSLAPAEYEFPRNNLEALAEKRGKRIYGNEGNT